MAEVNTDKGGGGKKGKPKKLSTHVDFTPMVDLGFLLITFFMLTTTMIKPQTMEISVPSKRKTDNPPQAKSSKAITVILGKENKIYYYEGTIKKDDKTDADLVLSDWSANGIRQLLLKKNAFVFNQIVDLRAEKKNKKINDKQFDSLARKAREYENGPVVLIKASDSSSYKNLVDILDEMQICSIAKYAIVDITPDDLALIKKFKK